MFLSALLAVVLGAVAIFAARLARSYFFGCPPELQHLPVVSVFQFIKSSLAGEPNNERAKRIAAVANKDGFARFWYMYRWTVVVADAHHVRKILADTETFPKLELGKINPNLLNVKIFGKSILNTNGSEWKRHRKVVAPAFHNFQPYVEVFAESSRQLSGIINAKIEKDPGCSVNMTDLFQRMTVDIICKAGFHYSLGALSGENSGFLSAYRTFIKFAFSQLVLMIPLLDKFNIGGRKTALIRSTAEMDAKLYEVIAERRMQVAAWNKEQTENALQGKSTGEASHPPNDLLALMIRACDADGTLTPEELRNDLLLFFVAGHETTANTLASMLYYLSAYPGVQEKIRDECNTIMTGKAKDATPTFEEQKRMSYMTCALKECLRLNGPVTALALRLCAPAEGAYLGSQHIPQGTYIMSNLYGFHHDPRVWGENVLEFDPSRFAEQADEGVEMSDKNGGSSGVRVASRPVEAPHTAWMPFGSGNRACTGKNFALIEQRIVLAHLLRQYQVCLPPDSKHRNGIVNACSALVAPEAMIVNFERI